MRKILSAFLLITVLLFSGCSDATELGNRAIIQAAAIDYYNGYRVCALLFSSGGSGGDTIDASQENVIKVVGTGETLSEAIDNISLADGKKIYMSETKLLVLGGGFSDESVRGVLDTLYYDFGCSLNMPVCCADNAELLTDLQFTEGITSAEKPLSIIENAFDLGVSPKTTLLDLFADFAADRVSLIPMFTLAVNGRGMTASDDGKTAVLSGSRALEGGRLSGYYDEEQTAGLMLKSELSDHILLNYFYDDEERTCEAYSVKLSENGGKFSVISAKFRTRTGGKLSDDERRAALETLEEIVA